VPVRCQFPLRCRHFIRVFGDRVLSIWHELSKSPFFTHWDWSPLIHMEVERAGFSVPSDTASARLRRTLPSTHPWASLNSSSVEPSSPTTPFTIPGLLAVHVRRGDYAEHCKFLAWVKVEYGYWSAFGTYGVSQPTFPPGVPHHEIRPDHIDPTFPKLNDTLYDPPFARRFPRNPDGSVDPTTLTLEELIQYHCYQDLDATRNRLYAVREWQRAKGRELKDVFILTNASEKWIWALEELLKDDGWGIKTSRDLTLSQDGQAVNQGVDMAIANWAEVFLGNGVRLCLITSGYLLTQSIPSSLVSPVMWLASDSPKVTQSTRSTSSDLIPSKKKKKAMESFRVCQGTALYYWNRARSEGHECRSRRAGLVRSTPIIDKLATWTCSSTLSTRGSETSLLVFSICLVG